MPGSTGRTEVPDAISIQYGQAALDRGSFDLGQQQENQNFRYNTHERLVKKDVGCERQIVIGRQI